MQPTSSMQQAEYCPFTCERQPASGSRGMVVSNHPQASAAGTEILLSGGNAIDAAIATLFALTVVEPMMVGLLGGGIAHIRLSTGQHIMVDGLSTAPMAASDTLYETVSDQLPHYRDTVGRVNLIGPLAVAVPGALAAWCHTLEQYGRLPIADVIAPAIRLAERGFITTPYLTDCVTDLAADLAGDKGLAHLFLPDGAPIPAGSRLVQADYAETLRVVAREGAAALYSEGGTLNAALVNTMQQTGGLITANDLSRYQVIERPPICGHYRGFEILGPPPPASAGVHIAQMLNLLEGFDIAAMGFGSPDAVHLLAEVLKIAFADRAVATADPAFIDVPVDRLIDKAYAEQRRSLIDLTRAQTWQAAVKVADSHSTTHVTVADSDGNVVASTQTINGLFGACLQIPETGLLANNYMFNFDPHPGMALSVQPGKRVFTSMAPMMVKRENHLCYALGLPGGLRIFPSAFQALVNLLDHRMSLQEAVEAPRIWTEGGTLEIEQGFPQELEQALIQRGHTISRLPRIAGGMNAIAFADDATLTGAACWRADGTPVAISGGLARAGIRFSGL